MTELNEYECEMLDAMLESFGAPGSLSRSQLIDLFDQDEETAVAMVQILAGEGLVAETGKHSSQQLSDKILLRPKGEKFLKEGGFSRRFRLSQQKPTEIIDTPIKSSQQKPVDIVDTPDKSSQQKPSDSTGTLAKLQQQNMKLQNQKLENESQITKLQEIIDRRQTLQYVYWALIVIALIIGYFIGKHKS